MTDADARDMHALAVGAKNTTPGAPTDAQIACRLLVEYDESNDSSVFLDRLEAAITYARKALSLHPAPSAAEPGVLIFPNPIDIAAAMTDQAKSRTSGENIADVLLALAKAGMGAPVTPSTAQGLSDAELAELHTFVRQTLRHHGSPAIHTALVADLIHGLHDRLAVNKGETK